MTGDQHRHRQRHCRRLGLLAFLLVSLCATREAGARAGGGGGFSGGGGGGGGGGGFSSGGGGSYRRERDGLFAGSCPNCGANLQLNQAAECEFCNAKVASGQYDWVLAEITQESAWKPSRHGEVHGFATMVAADPTFSLQHLEDRASVMFWRRIAALLSGKADPLRSMASEQCLEALEQELAPASDCGRRIPTGAAVGSVDTVGVLCEAPLDQALLDIHWSCGYQTIMPDGSRQDGESVETYGDYFILSRRHGVEGNVDAALSSSHCASCGSPTTTSAANACEYCGTVLNQGDRDWVLDAVCDTTDNRWFVLLSQIKQMAQTERSPEGTSASATPGDS